MRSAEFITETASPFTFKITGNWKDRVWITMYETAPVDRQWLVGSEPYEVGEVTIDPDSKAKTAYINRIDITNGKGQGKGSVLLTEVLRLLKEKGFVSATAYINHDNPNSRGLFKKLGFNFMHSDEWDAQYGDYWRKEL